MKKSTKSAGRKSPGTNVKELARKIAGAKKRAKLALESAREAKTGYKEARKKFKEAKKLAKKARRKLKTLEKSLVAKPARRKPAAGPAAKKGRTVAAKAVPAAHSVGSQEQPAAVPPTAGLSA